MLVFFGLSSFSLVWGIGTKIPIGGGNFGHARPSDVQRSCLTWAELTTLQYRRVKPVEPELGLSGDGLRFGT